MIVIKNLPLRVIDFNFNLICEIDQYSSLQLTRSDADVGLLELQINRYLLHADKLQKGHIIFPSNHLHKAFIIRHREIELDEDGKATENWLIKAQSLKSFATQRLIYPATGKTHESVTGNVETVMRHFVNTQMINPSDSKRKFPNLVLAANQNRGATVSEQSRYDNLAEKLTELSQLHNLGWNIVLNINSKQFVFTISQGRDLTASQQNSPSAIFSTEFETLESLSYLESDLEYKNFAVVAGQGEGLDRRIVTIGDAQGRDRFEMFVDARDISEETEGETPQPRPVVDIVADLTKRGNEKLSEHIQEVFMEGQALTSSRLMYERDYDLGDTVTLQDRGWGVMMDTRITAIKEIYEYGKQKIELTFDKDRPTFMSKIKKEISAINPELKK
ncbi:siphovirus ReqiPepy6 Gp37-like family protein [Lysinibacillus sp. CD3-6]|uniref:siphovirus ReqiPepy6 Gp37-like family protein n=1 Tax=Lysinibacillus sp. CD3-6 TaxID=2892541 RepID=UPI001D17CC60|nr:siphovirus ReqiPepy6 Gp37-like family protein [Lysinibacillus sp. CD3-6]UED81963.1 siphovirus ReqiPepy6 Gp37-like family protein [Lysinibacillus sp. CD3-6]